jgi:hypothetical protein
MTSIAVKRHSPDPLVVLVLFSILGLVVAGLFLSESRPVTKGNPGTISEDVILGTHAVENHALASEVRNCPKGSTAIKLYNEKTGRTGTICEFRPSQYGRFIEEVRDDGLRHEVTSFADEAPRENSLNAVIRNMYNVGYKNIILGSVKEGLKTQIAEILARIP